MSDEKVTGIPLTVVETYTDGKGLDWVTVEDPDGVQINLRREWVKGNPETNFQMDHLAIDLPPDELAEIWDKAAKAQRPEDPNLGGFGEGEEFESVYAQWLNDQFEMENEAAKGWKPGDPQQGAVIEGAPPRPMSAGFMAQLRGEGPARYFTRQEPPAPEPYGFTRGGVPAAAEPPTPPAPPSFNRLSGLFGTVAAKKATMRKQDIPANAGGGWGNWDQTWNPRTKRWETK
jgi:hypothetical protein